MGDVYSKATKVIVWLGESTRESDLAIKFIKDFFRISGKSLFRDSTFNRKMRQFKSE
jgi:hypothetical protein